MQRLLGSIIGLRTSWIIILLATPAVSPTAQQAPSPARIGVVHLMHKLEAPVVIGLRQGLKENGYVEGRDFVLEIRAGKGRSVNALKASRELASSQVDLFVSAGTGATRAVKKRVGGLPIVFTQVGNPVGAGFVQNFTRPGGNMTGFSHLLPETTGKRLELLQKLIPSVRTVLIIFAPTNPTSSVAADVARRAAEKLNIHLIEHHIKTRDDVLVKVRELNRQTVDALLMLPDSLVVNAGKRIIEVAQRERLPVVFHEATWVRRGGLASYGTSFVDLGRRAARYVVKILNGANPADLPVQQPKRFEEVVNIKTAKALGLTIPPTVLFRADEVIQ